MKRFTSEEKTASELMTLYRSFGYAPYKMRKFEEYDLYVQNKSFLLSENVLTFTDPSGKLMALKPDVTLSVVRGCRKGEEKKICYNEKVYRPERGGGPFREITQTGVEYIGSVDAYAKCEILSLACASLSEVSDDYRLCVFDTFFFSFFADRAAKDEETRALLSKYFADKNRAALRGLASSGRIVKTAAKKLSRLLDVNGEPEKAFQTLRAIDRAPAFLDAVNALESVTRTVGSDRIRIDPTVSADLSYYEGIIFRGYIEGAGDSVLSGGQYDRLMKKMGKEQSALGFAVYLDRIPPKSSPDKYDADVLLVYGDAAPAAVLDAVRRIAATGKTVRAAPVPPTGVRAKKTVFLKNDKEGKV